MSAFVVNLERCLQDFEDFMSVEGIIGAANSAWWDVSRYSFSVKLALMALIVFVIAFVVSSSLKMIMKSKKRIY